MFVPFDITLALVAVVFGIACYKLGMLHKNRRDYHAGFKAGRAEERTFRNAIMITQKMEAFKKGRFVERAKASWAARN